MAVVRTDLSQALSLEDWRGIVKHILQNIETRDSMGQLVRGLPRVLAVGRELFSARGTDIRKAELPHSGFARAFQLRLEPTSAATEEGADQLDRFLMGERVPAGVLSRYERISDHRRSDIRSWCDLPSI